jgi:GNAT superfamily N-acetyltransferase
MIRPANIDDLPKLTGLADEFFASSAHLVAFDPAVFGNTWREILNAGVGVIFIAFEDDVPTGAIGGMSYKDPNNGRQTASEMFWFVRPDRRGIGVALYAQFENWARSRSCVDIRMVHLSDSMPSKVKRFYEAIGYREVETHYAKEIK